MNPNPEHAKLNNHIDEVQKKRAAEEAAWLSVHTRKRVAEEDPTAILLDETARRIYFQRFGRDEWDTLPDSARSDLLREAMIVIHTNRRQQTADEWRGNYGKEDSGK